MNKMLHEEVIPTLPLDKQDLENFASAVEDRFNNPFVDHELMSISLNSTSKWKARNMPSFLEYIQEKGEMCIRDSEQIEQRVLDAGGVNGDRGAAAVGVLQHRFQEVLLLGVDGVLSAGGLGLGQLVVHDVGDNDVAAHLTGNTQNGAAQSARAIEQKHVLLLQLSPGAGLDGNGLSLIHI